MQNYNFVKNDVFVAKICKYALYESSEGLFCARRKPANPCHTAMRKYSNKARSTFQGILNIKIFSKSNTW